MDSEVIPTSQHYQDFDISDNTFFVQQIEREHFKGIQKLINLMCQFNIPEKCYNFITEAIKLREKTPLRNSTIFFNVFCITNISQGISSSRNTILCQNENIFLT